MSRQSGFSLSDALAHERELPDTVRFRRLWDGPGRYRLSVLVPGEAHRREVANEAEWERVKKCITRELTR